MDNSPVIELETAAIFDTGTTMVLGDPAGIEALFAPLVSYSGAEPLLDSPGYYTSTWADIAADATEFDSFIS